MSNHRLAQPRVALYKAHALLQLIQNALGFLGAAACCVAHVHLDQARPNRGKVRNERRFERGLLRRGHHHVELRAALLRVVDLLDAVGPLERCGRVPRIHQHHRVPDGTDPLAEQLIVFLAVSLPDHVVHHPEERVLFPQPLLLEEVSECIDQRGDRLAFEPTHEHVGLAYVRRAPLLQPLAHGQPVLLFPAGEEELDDVAVDRDVHRERDLALRHQLGVAMEERMNVSSIVDLFHRVARQLR
eukprot:scaffold20955_cov66-Phaeocystis_antarctica.AAC.2